LADHSGVDCPHRPSQAIDERRRTHCHSTVESGRHHGRNGAECEGADDVDEHGPASTNETIHPADDNGADNAATTEAGEQKTKLPFVQLHGPTTPYAGVMAYHAAQQRIHSADPVTIIDTALRDSLRALKLSGMLHTLDARLTQAQAGELGHLEFLQVLCHDEITRRETMSIQRRLRRARFDQQTTLEEFDFAASPKLPAAQIRDLAALRWLHSGESVILHGPVGVGKPMWRKPSGTSRSAAAPTRFLKTSRALADLAGGHADRTWPRRLAELTRPHLLILDDFAMRELTAQQADDHYELISERAQAGRSLIATSNRSPRRLVPTVPQPRRRRVPPGPAHQHQPPGLHERTQLPPQQTTRPNRLDNHRHHQVEQQPRTTP
jgi:DNA replication protein DnaC